MTSVTFPSTKSPGTQLVTLHLVMMLSLARLCSVWHKARQMIAHWPGRLVGIGVVLVSARLLWVLTAPPSTGAPVIPERMWQDALGTLTLAVLTMWGARSPVRVPVILNTGDIGLVDCGFLSRPALAAGIIARLPIVLLGALYLTTVLVAVQPTPWAGLEPRLRLWAVLSALGIWLGSARLACGCVAWAFPRARPLLALAWCGPALAASGVVGARAPEQGFRALDVLGGAFAALTGHWSAAVLLAVMATLTYAVVIALAPRLTPLWAAPAYQIAAILDLAESRDASAALALMHPARASSGRIPDFIRGASAFAVRQLWEAKRRHTGRVLVFEVLAAYTISRLVGRLLPEWWPLGFLVVGGFAASSCALDGAPAEARYPLFSAASGTRGDALLVSLWSCLLPVSQAWAICAAVVLGGAHARLPGEAVGVAVGCAVAWPIIAAACAVAAALLTIRGVSNRLTSGVGGLAALGGPLLLVVGQGAGAFAPGYVVFAAQMGTAALAAWALLHLALARWSASRYTVRYVSGSADHTNTMTTPTETEE